MRFVHPPTHAPHRSGDGERLRAAESAARLRGTMMISQQEYAGGITALGLAAGARQVEG